MPSQASQGVFLRLLCGLQEASGPGAACARLVASTPDDEVASLGFWGQILRHAPTNMQLCSRTAHQDTAFVSECWTILVFDILRWGRWAATRPGRDKTQESRRVRHAPQQWAPLARQRCWVPWQVAWPKVGRGKAGVGKDVGCVEIYGDLQPDP